VKYLLYPVLSDLAQGEGAVTPRLPQGAPVPFAVTEIEYGLARNPGGRKAMWTLLNTISVLPFEREGARVTAQWRAQA
jgi:predicted nucleic acid-binding protein